MGLSFQSDFKLFGELFDQKDVYPPEVIRNEKVHKEHECRQLHHTDPNFPAVAPDVWAVDGRKKLSESNSEKIANPEEARKKCKNI